MEKQLVLKTDDGFSLVAALNTQNSNTVILWLHGITVNKDEYLNFFKDGAKYLSKKGIDSLRLDFRGHGESSGTSMDFSIVGQMLDSKAALNYLIKNYSADLNLYIVGCSFGAPPAIFTALNNEPFVKGLILISPVLSYQKTFLNAETDWGKSIFNSKTMLEFEKTKKLYIGANFPIGIQLIEEMKIMMPEDAIHKLQQKVSLIHGDADSMVPFSVSKQVALSSPNIEFTSIPNMDHGYMDESDEEGNGIKSQENKQRIYDIIFEVCHARK